MGRKSSAHHGMTNDPAKASESPRLGSALLAVVLSGVAFYLSTGLGRSWPLAWLAPVPVLIVAFQYSWRVSALAAFTAFFLGSLTIVSAYGPASAILAVPPALAFAAGTLATRAAARRIAPWLAGIVLPAVLTTYEFLYSLVSPHGTALSLGYSQTEFLPLLQLVSVTGLWGIVFMLGHVPAAAALAWQRRSMLPLLPALAILLAALAGGTVRLRNAPDPAGVRVGLTATDKGLPGSALTTDRALALTVVATYADRIRHLASLGAQIVVLPEKLVGVSPQGTDAVSAVLSEVARTSHVAVVAGLSLNGIQPRRNVALVFSPEGKLVATYDKRHLVPMLEAEFTNGTVPGLFTGPEGMWGVAICKDLDFPSWARAYGQCGVRLLAVPAWDFVRDAHMHSRMAVLRGVENGFAVARSAQQGVVTLSDAYGRVVADRSSADEPMIVERLSPGPGDTFYTRHGDWFGWANLVLLVALLAGTVWNDRRAKR